MLFSCFDVRLDSDIALGELTPADADDARPIVSVRRGRVPDALDGAEPSPHGLQASGDTALLNVPGIARFQVVAGHSITVDAAPDAAERDVRLFLLGSALGVLVYQRGLLPLHANAVVIDGRAHAVTGPSGAGKSTLAAWFARGGLPVLCDDVCVVRVDEAGVPWAYPGLPRLKLWQDAADALGRDTAGLDRAIEGRDKYHVPIGTIVADPVPLGGVYTLARADADAAGAIVPLSGADAMSAIIANSYRGHYAQTLGVAPRHFAQCAAIARAVGVHAVTRPWGFDRFDIEAERIAAHMAQAA